MGATDDERFWAKVDKTNECWLWTGATNSKGYGMLRRKDKGLLAHRYVLMLAGVALGAKQVDHICHVRTCVRPAHLRLVTNKQNHENMTGAQKNSATGVLGVCWEKFSERWVAHVRHNGRPYVKRFTDFDDACAHVVDLRNQLFTHNDADRINT